MTGILTSAHTAPGGSYLPYVVGVIVALLGGGGLATLLKTGSEGSKIVVDAAQGAVVVQAGVMNTLNAHLAEAQREIAEMRLENAALRASQDRLERENAALARRVAELERA